MVYHFFQEDYSSSSSLHGPVRTMLTHGYIAVDLFFVLSGFVMAKTYGSRFIERASITTYVDFLYKRLGRVYPLYIAVTLLAAGLAYAGGVRHAPLTVWTLIANVLLVQTWGFTDSFTAPAWSISTEFAAYLLFPVLIVCATSRNRVGTWLSAAAAALVLAFVATRTAAQLHQVAHGMPVRTGPLDVYAGGTVYPLLRCLAGFTLGLVSFRLFQSPIVNWLARRPFAADLAMAAVIALMAWPNSDFMVALLFVPLVVSLAGENSLTSRAMASPVIYWLGLVSYSIYLLHNLVQENLRKPILGGLDALHVPHAYTAAGACLIVVVIGFSAIAYYGLEKPARDWARGLVERRSPPIASEPAAP